VSAEKSEFKGWGLGLTLVKGLAEALGGRVELESSGSEGTTFCVMLPIDARGAARYSRRAKV
jgi:signal transduction histidine kinase